MTMGLIIGEGKFTGCSIQTSGGCASAGELDGAFPEHPGWDVHCRQ